MTDLLGIGQVRFQQKWHWMSGLTEIEHVWISAKVNMHVWFDKNWTWPDSKKIELHVGFGRSWTCQICKKTWNCESECLDIARVMCWKLDQKKRRLVWNWASQISSQIKLHVGSGSGGNRTCPEFSKSNIACLVCWELDMTGLKEKRNWMTDMWGVGLFLFVVNMTLRVCLAGAWTCLDSNTLGPACLLWWALDAKTHRIYSRRKQIWTKENLSNTVNGVQRSFR